jgi:hypothetical protein
MFIFYTCITHFHSYHFSVDLSAALPHAEEYPMEFAFSNFIYWHSRKEDVILIVADREDLFGTTAMYCNRRVLIAPYPDLDVDDEDNVDAKAIEKAYRTMAALIRRKSSHFDGYCADAAFATISQLTRNVRSSLIDVNTILMSQTCDLKKRYLSSGLMNADLSTPCKMVHKFKLYL